MAIQKPFAVVPVRLGVISTGNERAARFASHLSEYRNPGMVWQSNGIANLWVRGDFGSAKEVDFVSLISANAGAATTARLRLGDTQAEVDGAADYDSGAQIIISPSIVREDGKYVWHFELPALQTKRWWRIDIGSHIGDFQAASLVLGKRLQFADFYNPDFEFGMIDSAEIDWGRYGVVESADGIKWPNIAMNFGWISEADRVEKFQPLRDKLGKTGIAFWCFDPEPTEQRQIKTYFGWLREPAIFKPSSFRQDRWQASFNIISMI